MMKRPRLIKKNNQAIDRLYKEGQCRDCTVVVTRMDFAKILGKFTKVKIQYESSTTPKEKQKAIREIASPNSNSRLKNNENGMVLIHRNAYKEHPVKEILDSKKPNNVKSPVSSKRAINNNNNILKENNRLKKSPEVKDKVVKTYTRKNNKASLKRYSIVFESPKTKKSSETKNKISLLDLLPSIDKTLLPSEEWCIDYLPNTDEPKEDKVYDKIAAELEHLMYNEKSSIIQSGETNEASVNKSSDDFPSILDILNETPLDTNKSKTTGQTKSESPKSKLASSDVEAMLLGQPETSKPMDVSESSTINLTEVGLDNKSCADNIDEPASPSILDEALQKGIAEQLPEKVNEDHTENKYDKEISLKNVEAMDTDQNHKNSSSDTKIEIDMKGPAKEITHLVFKEMKNGSCNKSVTCPKNLTYVIEFAGKPAELLGAPSFVSSREDLQVLLQIVNESELQSCYVLH